MKGLDRVASSPVLSKKVSFPESDSEPRVRNAILAKSKSVITPDYEGPGPKPFRPVFVSLRTKYLTGFKTPVTDTDQKPWHFRKRASAFSLLSTNPSYYRTGEEGLMEAEDEALYAENTQNKVEIKANLERQTKLRTLKALAGILKNRTAVPTDTLKRMRHTKKRHAYEESGPAKAQVHLDSYETVVKLLKESHSTEIQGKKKHIKLIMDLPKLPFGKHVAYNAVKDFKKSHVVDFEPSAHLMDKITNEIWIKQMERRRQTEPEMAKTHKKTTSDINFQTEELQLYNSKLKVAEENLYLHYSTGSKFWKRDLMEKQAGWRGLYRLELKRQSDLNVTSTF